MHSRHSQFVTRKLLSTTDGGDVILLPLRLKLIGSLDSTRVLLRHKMFWQLLRIIRSKET